MDLCLGEPPAAVHPVVWMGELITALTARAPSGEMPRLLWGGLLVLAGIVLFGGGAWIGLAAVHAMQPTAGVLLGMLLLKASLSVRALGQHASEVRRFLQDGEIGQARAAVQRLVSRETSGLSPRQVMAAAIESVAENSVDSVIAPLFWFLLLGVPGAIGYRFVNTADAMVGYHGKYEYLGKAAARLDDALNWAPARLSLAVLTAASWLVGLKASKAWETGRSFGATTESPNAGWPMAAAAGALEVPLEKVGHYHLGEDPRANLMPRKISDAVALLYGATTLWALVSLGLLLSSPLGALPWKQL